MATLRAYRQFALTLPPHIGQLHTAASFTTLTAVVNGLISALASNYYQGRWLLRTSSGGGAADYDRQVTSFAGSTGTLTHAQTNYANTTDTSQAIELVLQEFPRLLLEDAVNLALQRLRYVSEDVIPLRFDDDTYSLAGRFNWVQEPADIHSVWYRQSPVLSRNRYMQLWNGVSAAAADGFTLAGAGATLARSTTITPEKGRYSAAITRVGTNCTLTQQVLEFYRNDPYFPGRTLLLVMNGYATDASRLRASITDGSGTQNTSYHSGGSTWEELTQTLTVSTTANAATRLSIAAEVNTGNTTGYVNQLYVADYSAIDAAIRDDYYQEVELAKDQDYYFDQGTLSLRVRKGFRVPGQLIVKTYRPYLLSTETLSAQTDTADAPLQEVAYGVLAHVLESVAAEKLHSPNKTDQGVGQTYARQAAQYERLFNRAARRHQYNGPPRPRRPLIPAVGR